MRSPTPLIETPQSISVITKDQIEAQAIDNLGGVLRYTPGATGDLYGTDNRGLGLQLRGISNANEPKISFCFYVRVSRLGCRNYQNSGHFSFGNV